MDKARNRKAQFIFSYLPILLLVSIQSSLGWATLGEQSQSVEFDRQMLDGVRTVSTHPSFEVHEISYRGQIVREYVSSSGTVFAITWKGMTHPDLSLLLGSYFDEISPALATPSARGGRRLQSLRSSHIVVEKGGHMRSVQGRAYIPTLIPDGVSLGEIL